VKRREVGWAVKLHGKSGAKCVHEVKQKARFKYRAFEREILHAAAAAWHSASLRV